MSEDLQSAQTPTPGQMIRAARESSGLHIAVLAAALKVPVRKLEALEADRWDELTDATFARALAGSVARYLRIDPVPVLAGLPSGRPDALDIPVGLGQAPAAPSASVVQSLRGPMMWAAVGLLVLAVVVYALPSHVLDWRTDGGARDAQPAVSAAAPSEPVMPSAAQAVDQPLTQPAAQPGPDASRASGPSDGAGAATQSPTSGVAGTTGGANAAGVTPPAQPPMPAAVQATGGATARAHLQLTIKAPSWVEVTDAEGKLRLQKLVPAGEVLDFDDAPSYSVVVGNAAGVQAVVNGQALNLSERARNNVARFVAR